MTQPLFLLGGDIESSIDQPEICATPLRRARSSRVQPHTRSQRGAGVVAMVLALATASLEWMPLPVQAETAGNVEDGIAAFEAGNYGEAYKALKPAAESGDAQAQYYIGGMYSMGLSVEKSLKSARYWFLRSVELGNSSAAVELGYMHSNGIGVTVNKAKALNYYRIAAEEDDPLAQRNLGLMYENGEGVDFDALMAARWYERAAAQGDPVAQTHLGQLTWMGTGEVPRDRRRALRLLRAAAEQDHAHGQYLYCANQTELYGPGSPELVEALKWCKLAADQGYPKSERTWEAADRWFLSPEQKVQAEKRAAEWSRQHR